MKKTKAKTRKFLIIFIILVLIMSTSAILYASSVIEDPKSISFQDKNLYDKVKTYFTDYNLKLNKNDEELILTVSEAELNEITELNLKGTEGTQISDITGVENFVNLVTLTLSDNNITDITPISQMANLTSLDISNNANINLYNKDEDICYLPNQSNLAELNIASTNNNDITFLKKLPKLKVLNASNNGISSTTPLNSLANLEKLDLSYNTSIKTIDDILTLTNIKELSIASTGITDLLHSEYDKDDYKVGIFLLDQLETLNIENNQLSIVPIYETFENEDGDDVVYLQNLKKLNFNYTGQSRVSYAKLALLQSLTHLYMKGNGITKVDDEIATLQNLQYINLAENEIEDISGFIKYDSDDNIEATLSAEQIILEHNEIQDISPLGMLDHDITYLDLSSNVVFYIDPIEGKYSFSEGLDLSRQGRDKYDDDGNEEIIWYMEVKEKTAKVNQYIILPTLFQNSKVNGSVAYSDNIQFSYENISLNTDPDYNEPGSYNVIIEPPIEDEEKTLSITLHGGSANGSKLHFKFTTSTSGIDSLLFEDANLASAISEYIYKNKEEDTYVVSRNNLLNITYDLIKNTKKLELADNNISKLAGLESFDQLTYLDLSKNNISTIDEIKTTVKLEELYLSNNPNLGDNNSAIKNLVKLINLDLSNTGMTNIVNLQDLITVWEGKKKYTLTHLNISSNALENIQNVGKISTLVDLNISNTGIKDISEIQTLTNLVTLNASLNEIEKIDALQGLTKLRTLMINNNQIEDITPISQIPLDVLNFSNNRVKDVSSLTNGYTTLNMNTNQISDISNFDGRLIDTFSVTNQKISHVIDTTESEDVLIQLPEILIDSKESGSKVYTAKEYLVSNCELSTDGQSVIVNPSELGNQIATVKIDGGNANDTTFAIAAPLKGEITYTPSNETPTNMSITATINFNRNNVTITNNDGNNTYIFENNGEFTFEYIDEYGFEGTTTAKVENIDKVKPQATSTEEVVDGKVVITITADEPIKQPEGWTISENQLVITKTYDVDTSEEVSLEDQAGNITVATITVKIDKVAPTITGVEDGEKYKNAVTPIVEDENLDTVTLTKDGNIVNNYESGTDITNAGTYVLTATDIFGNTTTVTFEIEISDKITSEDFTITEGDENLVRGITPKTTVEELKQSLESEMEFEIVDKTGNTVLDTAKIGTGYQIKMKNEKVYTLIVYGDINGDGQISIAELARASRIASEPNMTVGELELLAMDVSKDGSVKIPDLAVLSRLINE